MHLSKELHGEIIFFETLRNRMKSQMVNVEEFEVFFGEFMKTVKLFYDSIINLVELTGMLNDVFI